MRAIDLCPGYLISREGMVIRVRDKRLLKGCVNHHGYRVVGICGKRYSIHRLMALAFIPKKLGATQVNHIDGNKLNNSLSNLEWCSAKENTNHALRLGLVARPRGDKHWSRQHPERRAVGSRNGSSKLTSEAVFQMRQLSKEGVSSSKLGQRFGISKSQALRVVSGKHWST